MQDRKESNMEMVKYYVKDGEVKEFKVVQDECAESPREWDNATELYIEWSRGRRYGDDFKGKSLSEIIMDKAEEFLELEEDDYYKSDNSLIVMLQTKASDKVRIFPVYGYEHGGFTVSMGNGYPYNDRWDGGVAGLVFVTKARCDELGCDFSKAREIAEAEVKDFDMYLNGYVYGYQTEDDSCYGFYSEKWGDDLFNEIATEAGFKDVKFYDESEVEKIVTVEYRLK